MQRWSRNSDNAPTLMLTMVTIRRGVMLANGDIDCAPTLRVHAEALHPGRMR